MKRLTQIIKSTFENPASWLVAGIIFLGSFTIYNHDFAQDERVKELSVAAIDRCIETGGIPIFSIYDERLSNCIYPR